LYDSHCIEVTINVLLISALQLVDVSVQ
jgi:hypothetical protein